MKFTLLAAIVVAAGWNLSQNKSEAELSEFAIENVEALAGGESGGKNDKALAQKSNGDYCCAKLVDGNCTSSPDC